MLIMVQQKMSNVFYFNFIKYKKPNESAVSNTLPVIPDAPPPEPLPPEPPPPPPPCPVPPLLPDPPVPAPAPPAPLPPPEGATLDEHSP